MTATALPGPLAAWLQAQASALDTDATQAPAVVPQLGASGLLRLGVPVAAGGDGRATSAAVEAIAAVAEQSVAAAFVFWGQRAFIEYLLQSPNDGLRERWLPPLLAGATAGATGLSNAMKFLSGLESLQLEAEPLPAPSDAPHARFSLSGQVPWATNLRPQGFVVAVAVARRDGQAPLVAALPSGRDGLTRSEDLDLIALRGTNTAALRVAQLPLDAQDVLAWDAPAWLPRVRPAFLALQCGLSIGLARASLAAAQAVGASARGVLHEPLADTHGELDTMVAALLEGLDAGRFVGAPQALFRLRIRLAELAMQAVHLELQASGGRAYHRDQPLGFARRWREAAFIPIVTPSLTQLQGELRKQAAREAAAA